MRKNATTRLACLKAMMMRSILRSSAGSCARSTSVLYGLYRRSMTRSLTAQQVPAIWILYTLSYLDRANIGNAETGGMQAELHITSTQYSVILLVFFISYVLFEVPANMILHRVRPSLYLSLACLIWGGIAACMAACQTWSQIAAVRFCLGVVEAAFAPGVAYYLSCWYRTHELARRYSLYYTATAVSGAFSGLLAGVIIQYLDGARGLAGWRWLLLIEGVGSSFVALFTWPILPDWPSTTRWLSKEESMVAVRRLQRDGIAASRSEIDDKPSHGSALKLAFRDWRLYPLIFMYMLATGSQTIQYFVPALVGTLGYKGFTLQYMTIPIYGVAFVGIVTFCFLSDWKRERALFISITSGIAAVSFIITASVSDLKAKYAFLCFAVGGVYAACPLTLLWVSSVFRFPAEKRAMAIAIVNALGNSASIYGSFLWPSQDAPGYAPGFATTTYVLILVFCV